MTGLEGLSADAFAGTSVEKAFAKHTPDAAAFGAYVDKMKVLGTKDHHMSDAQVTSLSAGMLPQVPAARLVILPATSHVGISAASAVLAPMVNAFLDDVPPATPDFL